MSGITPIAGRKLATGYSTLFSVAFRHGFYNGRGGICSDLSVTPTPACAALMASLGIIFRDQGSGFAVLVDASRVAMLAALVRRSGAGAFGLSFRLQLGNPDLIGFSDLPIDTNPLQQTLYLTNRVTGKSDDGTTMFAGRAVSGSDFIPLTGSTLAVPTPARATASLVDAAGDPVVLPATVVAGVTQFDLSHASIGVYRPVLTTRAGRAVATAAGSPNGYLYDPDRSGAFGLIDLYVAAPQPGDASHGSFPIDPDSGTVTPTALTLQIAARPTYWRYFIVSPTARGVLADDLSITGAGIAFTRSPTTLPNGESASVFAAQQPIMLQQQPTEQFSLSGGRNAARGGRDAIAIKRLPSAPPAPVWPMQADAQTRAPPGSCVSEIYVYV